MISIKFNLSAFRVYCKQHGIRLLFAEYRKLIKAHGGVLIDDAAGMWPSSTGPGMVINFEDEIDATAFKLKFGL